jgi:hypothetical protein
MLSKGLVHGYFNPIRDIRWGVRVRLLGLCECEATHLGALKHPKTTPVLSREKKGNEGSYASEEANFTRERCIRVAAIVIMITPGVSNNCGVGEKNKREIKNLPFEITEKHTACNGSNIEINDQLSEIDG